MEMAIIAFAALAALLMAAILAPPARRRRARERLRAAWGRTDGGRALDEELVRDEAAGWRDIAATVAPEDTVDDVTWEDLDMDAVFCRVDRSTSVVGSEALYAMLRQTGTDAETLARRMALAEALCAGEEARLDVQQAALMIGRRHFHGALDFLRNAQADFPGPGYMLLAAVPVLCLLAGRFIRRCFWESFSLSASISLCIIAAKWSGLVRSMPLRIYPPYWRRQTALRAAGPRPLPRKCRGCAPCAQSCAACALSAACAGKPTMAAATRSR